MDKTQKSRKKRITAYFAFVIVFFIAEILQGVGKTVRFQGDYKTSVGDDSDYACGVMGGVRTL